MMEFSKLNERHKTTDPKSSEITRRTYIQKSTPIVFELQKVKDEEKILKESESQEKNCISLLFRNHTKRERRI